MSARIILVDDDTTTLVILMGLLRAEGFFVDAFDLAASAVAQLADTSYDVLVTDIDMPGMTGHQLIAAARPLRPAMGYIVVSGKVRSAHVAADVGWLRKPLELDVLVEMLRVH